MAWMKNKADLNDFIKWGAEHIRVNETDPRKLMGEQPLQMISEVFDVSPIEVAVNIIKTRLDRMLTLENRKNSTEDMKDSSYTYAQFPVKSN